MGTIAGLALAMGSVGVQAQSMASQDKVVHLNQIQVIGSHNSYDLGFAPSEEAWMKKVNPKGFEALDYAHKTLTHQLDGGVRQLEIDIVQDAKGGRFAHPKIVEITKQAGLPADPDFDPQHEMDKPGMKVIHIQDVSERSSCHLLTTCLTEVRAWSKAHPKHVPLFLLIETKHGAVKEIPGSVYAEDFTPAAFDALDAEIRSVFPADEIILPDAVRGSYPTLNAAIKAGHWPTLAESRGKVIFLMDQRPMESVYTEGHPSLKGRVLFTNAVPGEPDAAFTEENAGTKERIDGLVREGYLVRARADDSTVAARTNDTTRRDELLDSGAQMISTDYPLSEPSRWTGYSVGFSNGLPARCNLLNAPKGCNDLLLEPGTQSGGKPSPVHHLTAASENK
ncbi:Phosphoinositide phospholipase C, Ca2+-dependent [Bryocella elongata]|uniref:Phosphoinositide phospholipase C, Ca2+-dependent n=1 Tax=Bryocella elongata TaxID=863522 RepID=A0A1H6AXQ9_9BACT|nr:phosphatidylinositol-specific phospholipase C1-like protein [Bryocella elongata]SEG53423.1 Phosphoinositide phospholipase C, Ca2+-dependent [Bryocella elongata]